MIRKQLNSKDEKGFSISESFLDSGKSFEQLMQEILSQIANNKDFLSNYSGNEYLSVEYCILQAVIIK